jgi:heptaprenyl diphosphate synthase
VIIAVPVDFADATLTAEMADDLTAVEAALRDTSFGGDEMFAEVSRHMMAAGGKRFRAMLVLLAARFGDCRDKRIVPAAVAIELTHLATLFHDDVMDDAAIRRGQPSANSQFGNSIAILAGDYLFARASRILADLGPAAIRIQAETFGRLVDGQLLETVGVRPGEDPLDHYMHVITEKTGSLIATSGRFGAMFSGLSDEMTDLIAEACMRIGVAWQLSDDVLDVASTSTQSGKEPGTDLRQGVRTLPVLYALRGSGDSPSEARPDRSGAARRGAHAAARVGRPRGGARDRALLDRRRHRPAGKAPRRPRPPRLRVPLRLRYHPHRIACAGVSLIIRQYPDRNKSVIRKVTTTLWRRQCGRALRQLPKTQDGSGSRG